MSAGIRELLGFGPGDDVEDVPCWRCGDTGALIETTCINRCCVVLRCPSCSVDHGGWGPAGCRCRGGGPNPHSVRFLNRRRKRRRAVRLRDRGEPT